MLSLHFLLLIAVSLRFTCDAMKVSVSVPELVKLNDAFWLNCSYQTSSRAAHKQSSNFHPLAAPDSQQQEDIYAIKWYKDGVEFYKFLPSAKPKVSIYETNGIQLDRTRSYEGNVYVSKADVNSEGNYRCEILSEAPLFETVSKSKHLRVYALPVRGPRIEILDANGRAKSLKAQEISYAVGDRIELRCNSAPSKPAARLRWYLNEQELNIPTTNGSSAQGLGAPLSRQVRSAVNGVYDVKVSPIEHRVHYKNIYSSHSTLSLLLQQDDLINNKISFKCLASMRQEVALKSKQLILLMGKANEDPQEDQGKQTAGPSSRIVERQVEETQLDQSFQDAHVQRQKPQNQRHSMSRLRSSSLARSSAKPANELPISGDQLVAEMVAPTSSLAKMLYIYEDADSTLGASFVDSPAHLESYIESRRSNSYSLNDSTQEEANGLDPTRGVDNIELIQLWRERQARQRSLGAQSTLLGGSSPVLKRLHGSNFVSKSPLYLDELDSLRPLINWPPLDAGQLLLTGSNSIVAIPTSNSRAFAPDRSSVHINELAAQPNSGHLILEQLIHSLNCTCTEGLTDTKLGWLINDHVLDVQDIRNYAIRISPDHRQTWLTVGLQLKANIKQQPLMPTLQNPSSSLRSILAPYSQILNSPVASQTDLVNTRASGLQTNLRAPTSTNSQHSSVPNQIKFTCQATHSLLLYSSSEMITFDFNPPPTLVDTNTIDKFASSSSNNVIQASSAFQSSSAQGLYSIGLNIIAQRSHLSIFSLINSVIITSFIVRHQNL